MRFRLAYVTASKSLEPQFPRLLRGSSLRITLPDTRKTIIDIRHPDETEAKRLKPTDIVFLCEQDHVISPEADDVLSSLERRVLPPNSVPVPETARFLDQNGMIKERHIVPLKAMPVFYQTIQKYIYDDLYDTLQKSFRLLRWRYDLRTSASPLQLCTDIQYCRTNDTWRAAPFTIRLALHIGVANKIRDDTFLQEVAEEIASMMKSSSDEPISHMLFHEAWDQRTNNRRSAIVIAVAAAEVAVKSCIANLCPGTQWLLEETQSPPIGRILRKYWPTISTLPTIKGQKLTVPTQIIRKLEEAIKYRNKIVHVGDLIMEHEEIEDILQTIRDVLLICDCAQGHFWAAEYLGDDAQRLLSSKTR